MPETETQEESKKTDHPVVISSADPTAHASSDSRPNRAPKLGAISPPIAWPSPKIQEIAKWARPRVPLEGMRESAIPAETPAAVVLPISQQASSSAAPSVAQASLQVNRAVADDRLLDGAPTPQAARKLQFVRRIRQGQHSALEAWSQYRQRVYATLSKVGGRAHDLQEHAREFCRGALLRGGIQRARAIGTKQAGRMQQRLQSRVKTGLWQDRRQKLAAAAASARLRASEQTRTFALEIANQARRVSAYKVKLRLRMTPLTRLHAHFSAITRNAKPPVAAAHIDSRLWTSMAMGTLSALLALGVITGVRRYGSDPVPAKISGGSTAGSPAQSQSVTAPQAPAAAIKAELPKVFAASRKTTPSATAAASLTASTSSVSRERTKLHSRKARRNEDDDYVARNTYVYYGPNGKPSHR